MNRLIISIGSNSPDRATKITDALNWLGSLFYISSRSEIYSTPEYSGRFDPYLNCVVEALTEISSPEEIIISFKNYEQARGRTPESKSSGRVPIDLDLISFNADIIRPKEFHREYFLIGYKTLKPLTV
ncbi:MAG: 2-amino-4-hydroxy-6-hydroxymethyldihydropteridine diphosphokinase [Muribaculum sp.]|nr:2-amino-4-hydroxy-6-hydroxymethyldihydropteridine diphosphokinase [Muribaculum sp.]